MLDSMEGNHPRPLGSGSGEGLPVRTGTKPLPDKPNNISGQIPIRTPGNRSRSPSTAGQGCSEEGSLAKRPIHQQTVCGSQKRWILAPSDQSKTPQLAHEQPTLQDGGDPQSERTVKERGLDVLSRPKGCLPLSTHRGESQEVPSVHMGRHHLRIHLSAIWSLQCTKDLHETPSPGDGTFEIQRSEASNLPRRHLADGRRLGDSAEASPSDYYPSGAAGLHCEQVEVNPGPLPSDNLLGSPSGHHFNDTIFTDREDATNHQQLQADINKGIHYSARIGCCNWKNVSSTPGSIASSPSHTPPSAPVNSNTKEVPLSQNQGDIESRITGRDTMVDSPPTGVEWERHCSPSPRSDCTVRCLPSRLGSGEQRDKNGRSLVGSGKDPPHQLFGVAGRFICDQNLHQTQGQHPCPTADGQQHCSSLREQNGGHTFTEPVSPGLPPVAMVPGEKDPAVGRASPRNRKHSSRSRISASGNLHRMDAEQSSLSLDAADPRPLPDGLVCDQAESSTGQLCQLEAGPLCTGNRCVSAELERPGRLCISPLWSDREVPTEDQAGTGHHYHGSSPGALTGMVPDADGMPSGLLPESTQAGGSATKPIQPTPPSNNSRLTKASRLQSIRQQHAATGVSEKASELLLAGWSAGKNTAYQSGWARWSRWCGEREIDPVSCSIQPFLDFLADLYHGQGLQYRSINLIRSAVSMTHKNIEAAPIGQHPLVSRLMRGIYNSRPPTPQYCSTWDVAAVLSWLKDQGDNQDLSMKELSGKLSLLMALISANRTSELHALDLRFRTYSPDGVTFRLASLTKKRKVGAPLKECFFASFPHDSRLCVVQCLQAYEKATRKFRVIEPSTPAPLFLSYVRPHKPVTSQRIAHWIKDTLRKAGVDTNTFKAHSVRGASTSAGPTHYRCHENCRLEQGVNLPTVLLQSGTFSGEELCPYGAEHSR